MAKGLHPLCVYVLPPEYTCLFRLTRWSQYVYVSDLRREMLTLFISLGRLKGPDLEFPVVVLSSVVGSMLK